MSRQTWVGRVHGNVSHCAHGISYKELCGYCWEPDSATPGPIREGSSAPNQAPPAVSSALQAPEQRTSNLVADLRNETDPRDYQGHMFRAADEIERLTAELFKANLERTAACHYGREATAERDRLRLHHEQWHPTCSMPNATQGAPVETTAVQIPASTIPQADHCSCAINSHTCMIHGDVR